MKIAAGFLVCLAAALSLSAQSNLALAVHADMSAAPSPSPVLPAGPSIEEMGLRQLLTLKRVYVDRLTGGETAAQMRDIIIGSLQESKLFIVTENQERADAVLHGAAEDLVYTDVHNSSDGVNARMNLGASRGAIGNRTNQTAGFGFGENESEHSAERRHEAMATVRLTNKDGDVIWSTTQESLGAKYHGASADVAEKIAAKLKEDFEKARKVTR